jgi:hypothetical protein
MSQMQFSIRTLLAAIAAVGIGAALWTAEPPSWQLGAVEALLMAWVLASTEMLRMNSMGKPKAFWAGFTAECKLVTFFYFLCFVPVRNILLDADLFMSRPLGTLGVLANSLSIHFRPLFLSWAFAPVVGLLCVLTHWLLIRPPEPKD